MAGAQNIANYNAGLVTPNLSELDEPKKPEPTAVEHAAKTFGVSAGYIKDIKAIVKADPEK